MLFFMFFRVSYIPCEKGEEGGCGERTFFFLRNNGAKGRTKVVCIFPTASLSLKRIFWRGGQGPKKRRFMKPKKIYVDDGVGE